ncbi:MAG TPA: ribonuclease catalytic domain-containing protein [Candidatus Binataceae bacterium]|nr:ribonuclease catalytic domain-containing protein [Candidatus Binataceae bacterium]
MSDNDKYIGALVEYLEQGHLHAGLVVREQANQVAVIGANSREKVFSRDLVLLRHTEHKASRENLAAVLANIEEERQHLGADLDLNLLWEIVSEQSRSFRADELAELFFGRRSPSATSVMLEALLQDRLYFVRRHMEFVPRTADQVERLRVQQDKIRLRSEASRRTRSLLRAIIEDGLMPPADEAGALTLELRRYLDNPFTRNRDLIAMIEAALPDIPSAEAAYEILERIGGAPPGSRFALIGGVRDSFSEAALEEARSSVAPSRAPGDDDAAVTIDDDDTLEIDDAISCTPMADGSSRVRIHIALVADFVAKGGPMDQEAALRGTTVYLPEASIRMLPDTIATDRASLVAGRECHVLTTDAQISAGGDLLNYSIYPSRITIAERLSYEAADDLITGESGTATAAMLRRLHELASRLRELRRSAGALLIQRREAKVKVSPQGDIQISIIDNSSPSRELVAELMVLCNHAAARFAAEKRIPLVYRVKAAGGGDFAGQRPHLSIHPEFHAGIGLACYAQTSSPIRRYMDLVLQRQLIAALAGEGHPPYQPEELLRLLANAEASEAEGRELERRAKRYWTLRFLERNALGIPLEATVQRDGASAELDAYGIRGSLNGSPNISGQARIAVQIARLDPLRGWLALDYLRTIPPLQASAQMLSSEG